MVRSAKDWPWSSYRATAGQVAPHAGLTTEWLLGVLGKTRQNAQEAYRTFVAEGRNQPSPWKKLKNQIYLCSDRFVDDMQCKLDPEQSLKDIPKEQKQSPPRPLVEYQKNGVDRKTAMAKAYLSGHYTLEEVGAHFGCSYATVSRAVKAYENTM